MMDQLSAVLGIEFTAETWQQIATQLHFVRPEWFWAFIPLVLLMLLVWRGHVSSRSWRNVVDAQLLPHLLIGENGRRRPWSLLFIFLAGALGIGALAGPVWQQLEQPVFRQQSALVVLLDLSRSMDAKDVRPSRLQRVRLKVHDILTQRNEGQTALIAYAGTPYVVSPLTSDGSTIAGQLPSLTTDLMPAQGSRLDRAIDNARDLLQQAGVAKGSVLVVTDGVDGTPKGALDKSLNKLKQAGHRLLVLGVGTASGAPIPKLKGGFLTDKKGAIVLPKMDAAALRDLADKGNGIYRHLAADDKDINALMAIVDADNQEQVAEQVEDMMSDQWREEGALLLLPLMLVAMFAFRRGYLVVLVTVLVLPQADPAMAAEEARTDSSWGFSWDSLWSNKDQRAYKKLNEGDANAAAQLFETPEWRAAAQYRNEDYEGSLETLEGLETAEADYNRGNALTQLGRLEEALAAYDTALEKNPENEDAQFNRDLVEQLLKQQEQQQKGEDGDEQQGEEGGDSQQEGDQGENQQQSGEQQQGGDQQQSQQSSGDEFGEEAEEQNAQSASEEEGDAEESEEQQAMRDGEESENPEDEQQQAQQAQLSESEMTEQEQATEQWLRRIPDDPGGLWRRKFLYQYQRAQDKAGDEEQAW